MPLNPPLEDWQGKVVWVIGASSGIGRATASLLHAQGARVVVSARTSDALTNFVAGHPGSHPITLDVSDTGAMQQACDQVLTSHGRLDVVLYSAGHYQAMQADSFDLRQMLHHLQVNFVGALNLLDAVLPVLLRQQHGHVSLVASVAGFRGLPKALAYGPTKAALIHLAEALYLDLRPQGIGVSVINPGFVATPLTAGNRFDMPALITPEQAATAIMSGWKRGRFGIDFPKRFTFWLQLMRLLPYSAYFAIVRRVTRA
jgi:NAD(P)-dependent dehydrogenase (short-subunit alcohol dehydrogenase family)